MSWLNEKKKSLKTKKKLEKRKKIRIEEERLKKEQFQKDLIKNEKEFKEQILTLFKSLNITFQRDLEFFIFNNISKSLLRFTSNKICSNEDDVSYSEKLLDSIICDKTDLSEVNIFNHFFLLFSFTKLEIPITDSNKLFFLNANDKEHPDNLNKIIQHLSSLSSERINKYRIPYFTDFSLYHADISKFNDFVRSLGIKVKPSYLDRGTGNRLIDFKISFTKIISLKDFEILKDLHDQVIKDPMYLFLRNLLYKEKFEFENQDSDLLEAIKEKYLKEKRSYNNTINNYRNMDLSNIELEIKPYYYSLLSIYNHAKKYSPKKSKMKDDFKITSQIIASFIGMKAIALINGFNSNKNTDFVAFEPSRHGKNKSTIGLETPKSWDHIWIDGVGWMHEDEVRRDR